MTRTPQSSPEQDTSFVIYFADAERRILAGWSLTHREATCAQIIRIRGGRS
jgi:hypothetical protein